MLKDKKIVLGVTGGIAVYKAAELTRALIREDAQVRVVMTRSATEFVGPLTFQTLSNHAVYTDPYAPTAQYDMAHISLAAWADAFVIAPATANIIGKIAGGIADDLLSTTIMAQVKPTLICPAMNDHMLANPIVKDNIRKLRQYGYSVMDSDEGELACKTTGSGRLPQPQRIVEEVERVLTVKDFADQHILITAGPTQEPLDPVRYITNGSSGKMGYALARAARLRGARVTLISGPVALSRPTVDEFVSVRTAREMHTAVMEHLEPVTVVIKAAAVADYRPREVSCDKIKKDFLSCTVELDRNPDILEEIGKKKRDAVLVGFAMETKDLIENAKAKLVKKNLDMIVANNLSDEGAGFQTDTNVITILTRDGKRQSLPIMTKIEAAHAIMDQILTLKKMKGSGKAR